MSLLGKWFTKYDSKKNESAQLRPARNVSRRPIDLSGSRISTLMEFCTRFHGIDDITPAIEQTLRTALREIDADLGYIMVIDEAEETLFTEVAVSLGKERVIPHSKTVFEGIEGSVIKTGEKVIHYKWMKSNIDLPVPSDYEGESLLCVPLANIRDGSTLKASGTLTIIRDQKKRQFRPSDEETAFSLATLASITIGNSARYRSMRKSFISSLIAMASAVEAKAPYMEGHSSRVAYICVMIGKRLGLDEQALEDLRNGAYLHEIGKIGIPDHILQKPGHITDEELTELRRYPVIGYDICKPLGLGDEILTLIRNHPERLDGTGYPDRLKYGELPLPLRIMCVADAFDAMSSYRPYRKGMDSKARQEQLNRFAGTQFDPIIIETLKTILSEGKLETLYDEHWDKYRSREQGYTAHPPATNPLHITVPEILSIPDIETELPPISHTSAEPRIETTVNDFSEMQEAPSQLTSNGQDDNLNSYWESETWQASFFDRTDYPAKTDLYINIEDTNADELSLEDAAIEAAKFTSAALEAVKNEKKSDKAA